MSDTTENSAADSASTEEKAPRRRAPRRATTTEPLATAEAVTASATVTGSESNRSSDESELAAAPRRGRGKKVEAEGATDAPAERSSSRKSTASSAESEASSTDGDSAGDSAGAAERPARSRSRSRSRNTNGNQNGSSADGDADADGSAGDRSNRNRQRDRRRGRGLSEEIEPEILEDDVLLPIGGILDVLENYAFVRTAGYLPGANDVYVSLGQVKKYNLRRGDAIVGSIKQPREGENFGRQKFNALVRIDSINGQSQEEAATRDDFATLVPLFPQERLRLETTSDRLTGRLIDVIAPVGKGQRGLVAGGPASGKSAVLLQIAEAVSTNNPEVHVMVVLVDARPEEVTEAERTVKGEVIASTFDRPAEDHTMVAELAVERAKRLVELGQDVVLLLDSLTALGRAYAVSSASSARGSHSGVDAAALYPAKKFFGAARNIENGGSLTVIASVVTETGSAVDSAILDEFVDNANLELRLSRTVADQRIFPAVDVTASGTRREDLLLGGDEVALTWKLRRGLAARGPRAALEYVLGKLGDTPTNVEFLINVQRDSSLDETSGAGN